MLFGNPLCCAHCPLLRTLGAQPAVKGNAAYRFFLGEGLPTVRLLIPRSARSDRMGLLS
jgi:hypothetical protein